MYTLTRFPFHSFLPLAIRLECEIPEGVAPGTKFNIDHDDRTFEVVCPQDTVPGQTIYVLAPKVKFESLQSLIDASARTGLDVAKGLDAKYNIVDRAQSYKTYAIDKVTEFDEKYDVSSYRIVGYGKSILDGLVTRAKAIDEQYKIVDYLKSTYDRVYTFAVEIDKKYSVTATSARLVVGSVNFVLSTVAPKTLMGVAAQ